MLKMIGRVLVILLVVGVVTVGIYWIVEKNPSDIAGSSGRFELSRNEPQRTGRGGDLLMEGMHPGRGFREHGFDGEGSFWLGLLGMVRNLGIIALITFTVWSMNQVRRWVQKWLKRNHRNAVASSSSTPLQS